MVRMKTFVLIALNKRNVIADMDKQPRVFIGKLSELELLCRENKWNVKEIYHVGRAEDMAYLRVFENLKRSDVYYGKTRNEFSNETLRYIHEELTLHVRFTDNGIDGAPETGH